MARLARHRHRGPLRGRLRRPTRKERKDSPRRIDGGAVMAHDRAAAPSRHPPVSGLRPRERSPLSRIVARPDQAGCAIQPGARADGLPHECSGNHTQPPTYKERQRRCRRYARANKHPGRERGAQRPECLRQCRAQPNAQHSKERLGAVSHYSLQAENPPTGPQPWRRLPLAPGIVAGTGRWHSSVPGPIAPSGWLGGEPPLSHRPTEARHLPRRYSSKQANAPSRGSNRGHSHLPWRAELENERSEASDINGPGVLPAGSFVRA